MDKRELRDRLIKERLALDAEVRRACSGVISEKLAQSGAFAAAGTVMAYLPVRGEVDLSALIAHALYEGKRLCAPVCRDAGNEMSAAELRSAEETVSGRFGIPRPAGGRIVSPEEIDLVIVPGSVFGRNFHRIGYGMGFYDRFLRKTRAVKIGVCYNFCLINEIIPNEFDVKMDIIITETEVLYENTVY